MNKFLEVYNIIIENLIIWIDSERDGFIKGGCNVTRIVYDVNVRDLISVLFIRVEM